MKIQTTYEGETLIFTESEFKAFVHNVLVDTLSVINLKHAIKACRAELERGK